MFHFIRRNTSCLTNLTNRQQRSTDMKSLQDGGSYASNAWLILRLRFECFQLRLKVRNKKSELTRLRVQAEKLLLKMGNLVSQESDVLALDRRRSVLGDKLFDGLERVEGCHSLGVLNSSTNDEVRHGAKDSDLD